MGTIYLYLFLILGIYGTFAMVFDSNITSGKFDEKNSTFRIKSVIKKDLSHWGRHFREKAHHRVHRGKHHVPISSSFSTSTSLILPSNQTNTLNSSKSFIGELKNNEHNKSYHKSSLISSRIFDSAFPKDIFDFWRPYGISTTTKKPSTTSVTLKTSEKLLSSKENELKINKSTMQDNIFIIEGLRLFEDPLLDFAKFDEDFKAKSMNPTNYLNGRNQDPFAKSISLLHLDFENTFKDEPLPALKMFEKFDASGKYNVESLPTLKMSEKFDASGKYNVDAPLLKGPERLQFIELTTKNTKINDSKPIAENTNDESVKKIILETDFQSSFLSTFYATIAFFGLLFAVRIWWNRGVSKKKQNFTTLSDSIFLPNHKNRRIVI